MTIAIGTEQTLKTVGRLRQALLDAIIPGATVVLDLAAIAVVDLAFVQVIIAARRHAAAIGADLQLAAPAPQSVLDVCDKAGFFPAALPFWTHGAHRA